MRVVHLETGTRLYGGARQVLYLMDGLARRGVAQSLVCPTGSAVGAAAAAAGHTVTPVPCGGDLDAGLAVRVRRLLKAARPDVFHVHSRRGADTWGLLGAAGLGAAVVVTRRVDNRDNRLAVGARLRLADAFAAISDGVRVAMVADGIPARRITVIRSAIDLERYGDCRGGGGELRRALALPADALLVAVVAQLIERKGHRVLLEALPRLVAHFPALRVVLFGRGPLEAELRARAAALGVAGHVAFAGFDEALHHKLGAMDLVVHPALMEGLGVALLEASACGVAIVAACAGGIPEAVRDGINGVLVPPGDAAALGDAVAALLADPARRAAMGRAGRRLMAREFSVEAMTDAYLRLYETARGGREPGA